MWAKVLGLVCVGVFVGAALVEIKQLRQRQGDEGPPESDPGLVDATVVAESTEDEDNSGAGLGQGDVVEAV